MKESALLIKSKEFALLIIKVCNEVKSTKRETVLTNQLIRSGTSVGANIREAFFGYSKADFVVKASQYYAIFSFYKNNVNFSLFLLHLQ